MALKLGQRGTIRSGPPQGVVNSRDPFDDSPKDLNDAMNMYIPVPDGGSGAYARPGFTLSNSGVPVYSSATPFRAQGGYSHTNLDGQVYNFIVLGGHLFRVDTTFGITTDVTPVGATIDPAITTRVKFVSLAGQMVATDGVNRPWIASDLASTPITATEIDYDGLGTDWAARDLTVYSGAVVFLLSFLGSDPATITIAWSAPGDPSLGYTQPTFDYEWALEQTGSFPIYAIHGTNVGLYYWRQDQIGIATGVLGPDFQTAHTDDSVATNVGTRSPQTIIGFTDRLFFTDQIGRPYMLPLGGHPIPIWQNMREEVATHDTSYQSVTQFTSTAAFDPTLNLYLVAIWSQTPSIQLPAVDWYAFDAATGKYMGLWFITSATFGKTSVELLCSFQDDVGRVTLIVSGSLNTAPDTNGYLWTFNALLGASDIMAEENLTDLMGLENGVDLMGTEGQEEVWKDNGVVPIRSITTNRLGYSADVVYNVDQITVITGDSSPVAVTVQTPNNAFTLEGTPTPAASQDGTYRLVCGTDVMGRGTQVTVTPTQADNQWSWQSVSMVVIPSRAGPDDA